MTDIHHLFYLSTATSLLTNEQLAEILAAARHSNAQNGLSGMLLYQDGSFIQHIEGQEKDLYQTWERIQLDRRHKNTIILTQGPLNARLFPNWEMGFADGTSFGGLELSATTLREKISEDFPLLTRTMMTTFYENRCGNIHREKFSA